MAVTDGFANHYRCRVNDGDCRKPIGRL